MGDVHGCQLNQLYALNDAYLAIQGEGCHTGQAMALVRLHGCPVGCPFCDTKETWIAAEPFKVPSITEALGTNPRWCEVEPAAVAIYLRRTMPQIPWVLLTGGEPAMRPLGPLVSALHGSGYKVALETSGTALGHLDAGCDWVCVSPKYDMPGGLPVLDAALDSADELKFVVGKQADLGVVDACLSRLTPKPSRIVCLQPLSCQSKATELCIETVKARGWRLSLQIHKMIAER